jgi:hypothetical protein
VSGGGGCLAATTGAFNHWGLPTGAVSLRAPPDPGEGLAADPPREWSSEPVLDDLSIPDPGLA